MKTRIKKLIDEHVIQPLANALLTRFTPVLKGGFKTIMDVLDNIKQQLDTLRDEVRASKERADAVDSRFGKLQQSINEHPNLSDDPRLNSIAEEIASIRGDVAGIAPLPAPAAQPSTDAGDSGGGTATTDSQP